MSVLPGEGSHVILYGSTAFAARTRIHQGYLARPDMAGEFPVAVVLGPITAGTKELCRLLARRGFAAIAMEPGQRPGDLADLMRWISAPGTPWADPDRVGAVVTGGATVDTVGDVRAFVLVDAPSDVDTDGRPVLGLYGGDGAAAAAARGRHSDVPSSQWVFYADAAEGFWDLGADGYHAEAATDAIDRIASFLADSLAAV